MYMAYRMNECERKLRHTLQRKSAMHAAGGVHHNMTNTFGDGCLTAMFMPFWSMNMACAPDGDLLVRSQHPMAVICRKGATPFQHECTKRIGGITVIENFRLCTDGYVLHTTLEYLATACNLRTN